MNSIYKDQNSRDYKPKNDNFMKKKKWSNGTFLRASAN